MSSFRARQLISKNLAIPTLPAVVQKIERLLSDPNTGAIEIGSLIAEDAPLTAKVLKIANSAYYGLRERCLLPQQATAVLGIRVLRNVVMQAAVFRQYDHLRGGAFDIDALWRHSVVTAQACQFLGRRAQQKIGYAPDEAYACGLLHDLGQVVMLEGLGDTYVAAATAAKTERIPLFAAESRAFGFTHADVGSLVAAQWGLPQAIASAIQHHHGPREAIEADVLVALVANANLLVERLLAGNVTGAANVFDAATCTRLGIGRADVEALIEFVTNAHATVEV